MSDWRPLSDFFVSPEHQNASLAFYWVIKHNTHYDISAAILCPFIKIVDTSVVEQNFGIYITVDPFVFT